MTKIGFIGTGLMGQGMVRNLMKAGFEVQVWNRTKQKAESLIQEGATWKENALVKTGRNPPYFSEGI